MVHGEIHIGECQKADIVRSYLKGKDIDKIYIIGDAMDLDTDKEIYVCPFSESDMYKHYYYLLQHINPRSLVILNEVLKRENRYDLKYNCIRKYVIQTNHRLVFNCFPLIKHEEDFAVLYDMIQDNPFLKEPYKYITHFEGVHLHHFYLNLNVTEHSFDEAVVQEYEAEKEAVIKEVKKDPNIIPRRLLKWSEKRKPKGYDSMGKVKPDMKICVSNLKVDKYYYGELLRVKGELDNARETLQH